MESIISLQNGVIATSQYILSTENLAQIESNMQDAINEFHMWIAMVQYGTNSPEFRNSDEWETYQSRGHDIVVEKGTPEMISQMKEVESHYENLIKHFDMMVENHNQRVKYNFNYENKSLDL